MALAREISARSVQRSLSLAHSPRHMQGGVQRSTSGTVFVPSTIVKLSSV